ncbi:peptidylprolyl isomerase [Synechococcus sp. CBW1108]|uniref:peptidylprolyl isomerase n=1 Tax=Synechococcus sp. CBW1108 TaxID=1353147 RepID=UPI0018CEE763|nr:peptidylprolyl isomerase [Synechococcus sp. CBW1108]QPN71463.1 peptidylprolyl isomerase [Synechococcus sp. CBW1108]
MALRLDAFSEAALAELRRHNLLQLLVQRQLVAAAVADASPEPEALEQAKQQFLRNQKLTEPEALRAYLLNNCLSEADLTWQIELPLRIRAHCNEHYRHKAEAHFLARKNQLDRVVYSLLRVKDGYLARELYLRLDAGEANFADLAAEFSEGPEKQTKGILGPVPLTQAHPALAERLRTSPAGQLMQPFQIESWWLVARLESYTPATFDDNIATQMAAELFEQWVKEETSLRMRDLQLAGTGTTTA